MSMNCLNPNIIHPLKPLLKPHHHPNYLTFPPNSNSNSNSNSNPKQKWSLQSSTNHLGPTPIDSLKPYLHSQWALILPGWAFGAVSVFSLSVIVPKAGSLSLSSNFSDANLVASLFALRLAANYLQQALLWQAAFNCEFEIRKHVFRSVLQRDLGYFDALSAADVAHRITSEAAHVADTVFSLLNTIVPSTLQLSAMAAQMLSISPALSLTSALVIPCVALSITFLGSRLQRISKAAHLSTAALSAYLNEVLSSILFVKASNMEWSECVRFNRLANADLSRQLRKKKMKAFIPQIVQAVYFGTLFVVCAGSVVLSRGTFSMRSLISFVTSLVFLVEPIQDVGKAYNELKQGEPAIERLFSLARFSPQVLEKRDAIALASVEDLHIKAGQTVALVGPSGGGKTTLAKLLLRLYDPLRGCILIDGHDIQSLQLESLRSHVALVSQDIILFTGTVAENIGYRDLMRGVDLERVKAAAETANADEFIRSLPNGYETSIGARGSTLSGGQKQRLAIARALYQNSSILIMDEATSALDSRSELLVREAVERVMQNHTVLVIAHRLETVLMAERVLLLEDGRLREVERSTLVNGHGDLKSSSGLVI
ncbi:hypothetical protein vseg_010930 [Gypsophila vaccaria]